MDETHSAVYSALSTGSIGRKLQRRLLPIHTFRRHYSVSATSVFDGSVAAARMRRTSGQRLTAHAGYAVSPGGGGLGCTPEMAASR